VPRGIARLGWKARFITAALPLVLPGLVFLAVLGTGHAVWRTGVPDEPYAKSTCTWSCHNRTCRHTPRLPAILTSDRGLFGRTIRALGHAGSALSSDRRTGYGAANLLLFCLIWPGTMYVLAVTALRQRVRLARLERPTEGTES